MIVKINESIRIAKAFLGPKIFCISFQRTGTTSTGKFFSDHGYRVAGYGQSRANDWTPKWFSGNMDSIFNSRSFRLSQVFQDDPWWCQDFYKLLFHRFPTSKFILFERDSLNWFNSMVSHSKGRSLGNSYIHSRIYRREMDYYKLNVSAALYSREVDNLLGLDEGVRKHYQDIYELRNREVKEFFDAFDNSRLFNCRLEDPDKWRKLGDFFGIRVHPEYNAHANNSNLVR